MRRSAWLATCSLLAATAVPVVWLAPADAKPAPLPKLTAKAVTVGETAGKAVVRLTLSAKAKRTVKVAWHTKDGSAKAGTDYAKAKGTATIKKGARTGSIAVRILDDAANEDPETFTVALASTQARAPKAVTVTITDGDPTAPRALAGTITASRTSGTPIGSISMTMTVHLVPTATAGEWRDDGTGTWSATGNETSMPGLPGCVALYADAISGTGVFLTAAGEPTTGQAALVVSGFDSARATGTPALTWKAAVADTVTNYFAGAPLPPLFIPTCTSSTTPGTYTYALDSPGATATYTGTTGGTRGLTFSYNASNGAATYNVTGSLTPAS